MYLNPFKNLILFGEIWNSTGSSLTATEREQWQKEIGSDGNIQSPEDRVITELKKTDDENKKWNIELNPLNKITFTTLFQDSVFS